MANRKSTKAPTNRKLSAAQLASNGAVSELRSGTGWSVASQSGRGSYLVTVARETPISTTLACTCPDARRHVCKHQLAVIIWTRASAKVARAASSGALVELAAATVARVLQAKDEFTRLALLALLAAIDGERATAPQALPFQAHVGLQAVA